MDLFAPYAHAVASLALWALLMAALLVGSTMGKARARTESGMIVRDYSDPAYRRDRAFRNAIEANGMFVAATVACILAGASPLLTNLLASAFVVARVATAAVHVFTENQMARSATWTVGALATLGLALLGLWAALA
nr:MAPEG family protein [Jannaschia sp. Os4]